MPPRSYLFVPGDSERKLEKAAASGADVLILDLEDSVAAERTSLARDMVRAFLQAQAGQARLMQQSSWFLPSMEFRPRPGSTSSCPGP
jgi:citrate lyase subunit beta/citryl-CoA lyase